MRSLKEIVTDPATVAEAFSNMLREKFPQVKVKILPWTFEQEDVAVDIFAPRKIFDDVDRYALELSMRIEDETGFFVLHFVRPLEEAG